MQITPYTEQCGAEVSGVQLARLSEDELETLRAAFASYGLLFFREQELSPDEHRHFAQRWGSIVVNKFFPESSTHAEIAEVRKEKDQQTNIGGGWHADHSYDEQPALGSILVARELPSKGGDTNFANLCAAYAALTPAFQKSLTSLTARHSNRHLYGANGYYRQTDLADQLGGEEMVGDALHPVVIQHPESGRPALYVNPGHTTQICDWSMAESRGLLDFLFAHVQKPEFTCRFHWEPGSVAFWDNRCTWHLADNDYAGEMRLMHRITLAGTPLHGVA